MTLNSSGVHKPLSFFYPLVTYSPLRLKLSDIHFFFDTGFHFRQDLCSQAKVQYTLTLSFCPCLTQPLLLESLGSPLCHGPASRCWVRLGPNCAPSLPLQPIDCLPGCQAHCSPSKMCEVGVNSFKNTLRALLGLQGSHEPCTDRQRGCRSEGGCAKPHSWRGGQWSFFPLLCS